MLLLDDCFSGAGVGEVEVVIMDPAGKKNTVTCSIEDKGNSSYRCTYKPTQEGQHTIYVTFAGGQISRSPFTVNVGEGESSIPGYWTCCRTGVPKTILEPLPAGS